MGFGKLISLIICFWSFYKSKEFEFDKYRDLKVKDIAYKGERKKLMASGEVSMHGYKDAEKEIFFSYIDENNNNVVSVSKALPGYSQPQDSNFTLIISEKTFHISKIFKVKYQRKEIYICCPNKGRTFLFFSNGKDAWTTGFMFNDGFDVDCHYDDVSEKLIINFINNPDVATLKYTRGSFSWINFQKLSESLGKVIASTTFKEEITSNNLSKFYSAFLYSNDGKLDFRIFQTKDLENSYEVLSLPGEKFQEYFPYLSYTKGSVSFYMHRYFIFVVYNEEGDFTLVVLEKKRGKGLEIENSYKMDYLPVDIDEPFQIVQIKFANETSRFLYYEVVTENQTHFFGIIDAFNFLLVSKVNISSATFVGVNGNFIALSNWTYFCPYNSEENEVCSICFSEKEESVKDYFIYEEGENSAEEPLNEGSTYGVFLEGCQEKNKRDYYYLDDYSFKEKCPLRFQAEKDTCHSCEKEEKAYSAKNKTCVNKNCDSGEANVNGICFSCNELKMYTLINSTKNGTCVEECENGIKDDKKMICQICSGENQYYFPKENKCVPNCDGLQAITVKETKTCLICDKDQLYYNSRCLEKGECPPFTIEEEGACKKCPGNFVAFEGECLEECPKNTVLDPYGFCKKCQSNTGISLVYNGECVKSCPDYTTEENGYCKSCYEDEGNKYYFEGRCVEVCPIHTVNDTFNHVCKRCSDEEYYFNNGCYENCPGGSYASLQVRGVCEECPRDKFIFNENCIDTCPDGFVKNATNCFSCKSINKKYQSGRCVDECSGASIFNKEYICISCPEEFPKLFNNSCVKQCVNHTFDPGNKVCISCDKKERPFYYEETCYKSCPDGLVPENNQKICINCTKIGEYYFNGSCYTDCPAGTIKGNTRCEKCPDGTYSYNNICLNKESTKNLICNDEDQSCKKCNSNQYAYNNKCYSTCPSQTVPMKDMCYNCIEDNKYKDPISNTCVSECPSGTELIKEDKVCRKCPAYYFNGACLDKCPEGTQIIPNTTECTQKCSGSLYSLGNECLSKEKCKNVHNGFVIDAVKLCKVCDNTQLRFGDSCVSKCPSETFEINKECRYCYQLNQTKKFYHEGKCVEKCPLGKYSNENLNFKCVSCQGPSLYLMYEDDLEETLISQGEKCVDYSQCIENFYEINETQKYCRKCPESKPFLKDKCEETCNKRSSVIEVNEEKGTKKCISCPDHKYLYGKECIDNCDVKGLELIPDEKNHVCLKRICSFKCFNDGTCDLNTNECVCKRGYSGKYCEIKSEMTYSNEENKVKIYVEEFEKDVVVFGFKTNLELEDINIKWNVESLGTSLNGNNEKFVKIPADNLSDGNYSVSLVVHDNFYNITLRDKIKYQYEKTTPERFHIEVDYKKDENFYAMKSIIKITVVDNKDSSLTDEFLMYQFFFVDIYNDELPLTEKKSIDNVYEGPLPFTEEIIVVITDGKGREYRLVYELNLKIIINPYDKATISQIVNAADGSYTYKSIYVYNYMVSTLEYPKPFTEEDFQVLLNFSKTALNQLGHSNTILSILHLYIKEATPNTIIPIFKVENLISERITDLTKNDTIEIRQKDFRGYFRNIDGIITEANSLQNRLRVLSEESTDKIKDLMIDSQKSFNNLNGLVSQFVEEGESMEITGKNFQSRITSPSLEKKPFSIPQKLSLKFRRLSKDEEDISHYNPSSSPSSSFSSECNENSDNLFCINKKNLYKLKQRVGLIDDKKMSIGLIEMDNSALYQGGDVRPISTSSITSDVYISGKMIEKEGKSLKVRKIEETESSEENDINEMKYILSYDIPKEIPFDSDYASNCSCVSFSQLKKPKQSVKCETYFNYQTNKTICKCSGTGEIVPVWNYALSSLSKFAQFPEIDSKIFNTFNTTFVLCCLFITSMFSLVLLVMDYLEDKNYKEKNAIDEFTKVKSLHNSNLLSLSWYATSYTYPFLSVVFLYNYGQPRFFRFLIQIFSSLVSIVFSSIPFYRSEFTYKNLFINKRDIETIDYDIHNLPAKINDILASFLYSIIASIISNFLVLIFQLLLRYKKLLRYYWEERKNLLNEYARMNYIYKRNRDKMLLFKTRFGTRCRALMAFGEGFFNKEQIKANREVYLKRTQEALGKKILYQKEKELKSLGKREKSVVDKIIRSTTLSSSLNETCLEVSSPENFVVDTNSNSFTLNGYTRDNKMKELEKVKKKYYIQLEDEIEQGVTKKIKKRKPCVTYDKDLLDIEYKNAFTFFNTKFNMNEITKNRKEKCQIALTFISVILLCCLFMVVYFYIFIIFGDIYKRYEFYIVKSWLIPSLTNIIVFRLFSTYGKNLAFLVVIRLFYKYRNNNFIFKLVFKFLIPKYLVHMVKVRDIINKYYNDFKEDIRKQKGEDSVLFF